MLETLILSESFLKGIFLSAIAYRSDCLDMDTCVEPGVYGVYGPQCANKPGEEKDYGILLVMAKFKNAVAQVFFSTNYEVYIRMRWDTWKGWRKVQLATLT